MAYTEEVARELVVKAGRELLEKKLVARTWGNISARVSDTEFVITPSGRGYEDLKPSDLVKVTMPDLSYEGTVKPSGEKGIHADVYAIHPEVNFVIHTHQVYASALSVCETDLADFNDETGEEQGYLVCVPYALPSTPMLRKKVCKAVLKWSMRDPSKNVFLLARHGALAFAPSYEEAFTAVNSLEAYAQVAVEEMLEPENEDLDKKPYLDDYAQIMGNRAKAETAESEETLALIKEKNTLASRYARAWDVKPLGKLDVWIQHVVYVNKYSKLK